MLNVLETEASNVMQMALDFNIRQGSARVVDEEKPEKSRATFADLQVGVRAYRKTLVCEGRLQFDGLCAPEGMVTEVMMLSTSVYWDMLAAPL